MKAPGFHRFAGVVAASVLCAAVVTSAAAQKTTKDKLYSKAQATRGEAMYAKLCASCHDPKKVPEGKKAAPELVGEKFLAEWENRTLGDLLTIIHTTMPNDGSAELTPAQTADVVAYMLQANGYPAGMADMKFDAVKDTVIVK